MASEKIQPLLLDFAPDATVEDFDAALKLILGRVGCLACGRLSVHLRAVDPDPELRELAEIGTFRSVVEIAPQMAVQSGGFSR